ncbi:hypothetical protein BLA60_19410 [Actinophytocola xinjiangensis]|uniref:Uncharacterized protein n=1 Tax=Actinophytocola xinjiangensis TaxID=485602 RepID=A0A7Z1AXL0_9PSEU|nr:hypothetical protein [Actinophytocola xinjiangensis]OLF09346.1 hypothetical protein BLA60_19410 [Actinophytocola xinjiangensis]
MSGDDRRTSHQRLRLLRADFLDRADVIDGGVRKLLADLDLDSFGEDRERMLDALMGISRAADALRALARGDLTEADEATSSMAYYARRALG